MDQVGYYSLLQFTPDLSRHEFVNIGVLVYSPRSQSLRVRFVDSNRRITQVFGKQDTAFLTNLKESFQNRLAREFFEDKQSLESFMSKRANAIQLTALQPLSITNLDADVSMLFGKLVEGAKERRRKRIDRFLGERLNEAGVAQLVQKSVTVHFPFFDEPIRAPFGYQNGRFNLISPVSFKDDLSDVTSKAGRRALEGKILFDHPDAGLGNLCLNVVGKFPDNFEDTVKAMIRNVLADNNVKFYDFSDLSQLIGDIKSAADSHKVL